jgi:protein phosphatase
LRGPLLVVALLVVVAGALFGGTWWYSQHQYYVGTDGQNVVIYRGINGSVLGIDFSSPIENTNIPVDSLPPFEQSRVKDAVTAHSRAQAQRIVDSLRAASSPESSPEQSPAPPSAPGATTSTPEASPQAVSP